MAENGFIPLGALSKPNGGTRCTEAGDCGAGGGGLGRTSASDLGPQEKQNGPPSGGPIVLDAETT